jgi:hypothetical protein
MPAARRTPPSNRFIISDIRCHASNIASTKGAGFVSTTKIEAKTLAQNTMATPRAPKSR